MNNKNMSNSDNNNDNNDNKNDDDLALLKIRIRSQQGEVLVEMLSGMLVKDLKEAIRETEHFCNVDYQNKRLRLVYSGRILDDDEKPLSFYNIATNAVIHAVLSDRVNHGNSNLNDQNANPENTMAQPSGNGRNVQFGGAQVVFVDGNSNQTMGQFSIPANGVNPMAFLNNLNLSGMLGNGSGNIVIGSGNGEPQILDFGSMASMGQNNNGNNNNNNNNNNNDNINNVNNNSQRNNNNSNNNPNNNTNICPHVLSMKNLDGRNVKCGNPICDQRVFGMAMGCTRCRHYLCINCYVEDLKLAKDRAATARTNDNNNNINNDNNVKNKISMPQGLLTISKALREYKELYDEAHHDDDDDDNDDLPSLESGGSDSDDMYK